MITTRRSNRELWAAFGAIVLITLGYLLGTIMLTGIPGSSDLFGHSLGLLGFFLMIMTETMYSWRKRSRRARWGRMSQWLDFHIFTGIVGPYMVLLHSAWRYNGLAGLAMLLTVIVVISGFIGRYIYTAVPRSAEGIEIERNQLEEQLAVLQEQLTLLAEGHPESSAWIDNNLKFTQTQTTGLSALTARAYQRWGQRRRWRKALRDLSPEMRQYANELIQLARRRQAIQRQVATLAAARRSLAIWHSVHIPLGMVLFSAAIIHSLAAFYYATLLR